MNFIEEVRDILNVDKKYFICHASSADLDMSTGLAHIIDNTYDLVNGIKKKYGEDFISVGSSYIVGNVITLIVKDRAENKPDLSNIKDCLEELGGMIDEEGIRYLAFPKICCGNMGMKWSDIKYLIKETFKYYDVTILICHDKESDIAPDINDVIKLLEDKYDAMPQETKKKIYDTIEKIVNEWEANSKLSDLFANGKKFSF